MPVAPRRTDSQVVGVASATTWWTTSDGACAVSGQEVSAGRAGNRPGYQPEDLNIYRFTDSTTEPEASIKRYGSRHRRSSPAFRHEARPTSPGRDPIHSAPSRSTQRPNLVRVTDLQKDSN